MQNIPLDNTNFSENSSLKCRSSKEIGILKEHVNKFMLKISKYENLFCSLRINCYNNKFTKKISKQKIIISCLWKKF